MQLFFGYSHFNKAAISKPGWHSDGIGLFVFSLFTVNKIGIHGDPRDTPAGIFFRQNLILVSDVRRSSIANVECSTLLGFVTTENTGPR